MISILIVDDHPIFREGIRKILETEQEFRVVADTGEADAVLPLVDRWRPDVAVLDLMLEGSMRGLDVLRQLRDNAPRVQVVVLSMYGNEAYVLEALRGGAAGYVLKGEPASELIRAIREVEAGRRYLPPSLSSLVIEAYATRRTPSAIDPYETLTEREREVLRQAAQGASANDIARRLAISPRTIEAHRARMMHKLRLKTQTDIVRYALRKGLIDVG